VRDLLGDGVDVLSGVLVRVNDAVNLGAGYGYTPFNSGVADLLAVGVLLGVSVLVGVVVLDGVRERVGERWPVAAYWSYITSAISQVAKRLITLISSIAPSK
jgi:hypothetical protein